MDTEHVKPKSRHSDRFLVVINPRSGKNRKQQYFKEVLQYLKASEIPHTVQFTDHPNHASQLIQKALTEGFRKFIVIGGDGTFNEVVQGACITKVPLSGLKFVFVPAGTGNDWHRTMFPDGFDLQMLASINKDDHYIAQDLGMVTYLSETPQPTHYFVNVMGLGFDVFVAKKYMTSSHKSGRFAYLYAAIRGLITYQNIPLTIIIGGHSIQTSSFMIAAGIGSYFAGGMKVLPGAMPNDGQIAITLFKDLSRMELFKALPQIYSGKFITHPKVETYQSTLLEVHGPPGTSIQLDGEIKGCLPVKIQLLPGALKVFAPQRL